MRVIGLVVRQQKRLLLHACGFVAGRWERTLLFAAAVSVQRAILLLMLLSWRLHRLGVGALPRSRSGIWYCSGLSGALWTVVLAWGPRGLAPYLLGQDMKTLCMSPALAQTPITQRYQCAYCQHQGIALRFLGFAIHEGADTRILVIVNEVATQSISLQLHNRYEQESYTVSSSTLWDPEGNDLYSTLFAMSTITTKSGYIFWSFHGCSGRTAF